MPKHRTLNGATKIFLIKLLAAYESPSQVIAEMKEIFGINLCYNSVIYYDPLRNEKLARKWTELFYSERAHFLRKLDNIAMQNISYRQSQRYKLYMQALQSNDNQSARLLLNDAADDAHRFEDIEFKRGRHNVHACDYSHTSPATRDNQEARITVVTD